MRLPCPFFSLQVALLCTCTLMAVVCLFGGGGLGLVQQHLSLGRVQRSYHPMGAWSGQNPLLLGLMGEEAALSRVSGGLGQCRDENSGLLALFCLCAWMGTAMWGPGEVLRRGKEERLAVVGSNFPVFSWTDCS